MDRDGDGRDGGGTWRVEGFSGTRDEEVERKCYELWWWQERKGRWAGEVDLRIWASTSRTRESIDEKAGRRGRDRDAFYGVQVQHMKIK